MPTCIADIQETTWVQYPSKKVPREPCCSAHVGNDGVQQQKDDTVRAILAALQEHQDEASAVQFSAVLRSAGHVEFLQ